MYTPYSVFSLITYAGNNIERREGKYGDINMQSEAAGYWLIMIYKYIVPLYLQLSA